MDKSLIKSSFFSGLDLGSRQDYSALVLVEKVVCDNKSEYLVRAIHRWPLRTPYPKIVEDIIHLFSRPPIKDSILCIDATGVGRAVVDMVRRSGVDARMIPITITAGHQMTRVNGEFHVPKKDLVGVLQVLISSRRIHVSNFLPEAKTLTKELSLFRVKIKAEATNVSFECLTAGTLIETVSGQKPIESILPGDEVLTRDGCKLVMWSGVTRKVSELIKIEFDNGIVLEGTPDHLIWVEKRFWVPLKDVKTHTDSCLLYSKKMDGMKYLVHPIKKRRQIPNSPVPVYDLIVNDWHEFFANGILVHNSWRTRDHDDLVLGLGLALFYAERIKKQPTLKILPIRRYIPEKMMNFIVCPRNQLGEVVTDQIALMVSIVDPRTESTNDLPSHGLSNLKESITLQFADINPTEYQNNWDKPIEPCGKKPSELLMNTEDGKHLWLFLLKKRQQNPAVLLFTDDTGQLALSLAYAIADCIRMKRESVLIVGIEDKSINTHVYETLKKSRVTVI